ncbi:MAG: type II toxin-antitoxin system Phd/YefM family antitoxin [Caldilineaceae bacterium]|nr:type II toxin-antitoxin system Phd/YefM family antitoxin [Caldilineaceae bacterium]MCB9138443.1 type II toxin-antitoxin system Phd/YefM family antitoxin [Caldilineaceae bacterium]
MITQLPQITSISDLRYRHREVFARLAGGPVMIANRNTPAAMLISPEEWNAIVAEIEDLRDVIAGLEAELAVATKQAAPETIDPEELQRWAAGDAISA